MTGEITLEVTTDYGAISEAADFFAGEFWTPGLDDKQRAKLAEQHRADFDRRYGELTGKRRFPSALLLAHSGGQILGCAGVEMTIVDAPGNQILDRPQAEALFADRFAAMGGRERNQYRKASLEELAAVFLDQGQETIRPVLSNLAVRRESRGTGLGTRLIEGCEGIARSAGSWSGDDLWLLVEERNVPAVKRYSKLGYLTMWKREELATRAVGGAGGSLELVQEPTQLLAMAKKLQG
jgi:ribosomal protein S18 acetylase RimI-like enzyme